MPAETAPRWVRRFVGIVAILAGIAGIASIAVSTLSYPALRGLLNRALPGGANHVTPAFYEKFTITLRCGGIVLLGAAAVAIVRIGRVSFELARTASECVFDLRQGIAEMREFLRRQSPLHKASVAAVLVVAIGVRAYYLFAQPMRYDEAFTYLTYVRHGLLRGFLNGYTPNNHLLHTIAVYGVTHVAGSSPASIRFPAFVAGIFAVFAGYYCFARFFGSTAGLMAAAFIAVNAELISFSTNARGYAFLTALFPIQLLIAHTLAKEPWKRGLWGCFVAVSVAEIWTVPTGVYAVAGSAGVYLLWAIRNRSGFGRALRPLVFAGIFAVAVSGFLYWPVMLGSGPDALFENRFVKPESVREFMLRAPGSFGEIWNQWNAGWFPWFAWVVTGAWALGIVASFSRRKTSAFAIFPVTAAICIAMAIAQRVTPGTRVWLFLLPVYLGTAALGLDVVVSGIRQLKVSWRACVAAWLILIAGGLQVLMSGAVLVFADTGTNNDAPNVARFLASNLKDGDLVIGTLPASYPVRFYLVRAGVPESVWQSENRKIARVMAVVDKSEPLDSGIAEAFEQTYAGFNRSDFKPVATLYDSDQTRVIALVRPAMPLP